MKHYVGLDVSLEETSISVIDDHGKEVWKGKTKSTPVAILKAIETKAPQVVKVGFETGPLSTWHWHEFRALGLPVVCLDARHAKAALSMQVNKTDANDARGLAQIVRTGWCREVQVKSIQSHLTSSLLKSRSVLVDMRTKLTNHLRGLLKTFGIILGNARGKAFEARVREITAGKLELCQIVSAVLGTWRSICEQIEALDRNIRQTAHGNEACKLLMTVPGVGPITAMAFCAVIDDPGRFAKSSSVGAYLGLTPRRYQSGEVDRNGRISKCGDAMVRTYLYEAANVILNRVGKWSKLKAWGVKLAKRVGNKKAKVAVARKLAVIMHRMWLDKSSFRWNAPKQA